MALGTAWEAGRLDAGRGPPRVLFGRMYEDADIERSVFPAGSRVFCIASAGCTALRLAPDHDVVAVDINPAQLAYAALRTTGEPMLRGTAEQIMSVGRKVMPLAGWTHDSIATFLAFIDVSAQFTYWQAHLDTWRFRTGLDTLMSVATLRAAYSPALLAVLPRRFGAVLRARMERCFRRHPNRTNPFARALLAGELADDGPSADAKRIHLVQSDAASYLEQAAPGSFGGFTLSNILDGAEPLYRERLFRAVARAAAPDAMVILRSFGEPKGALPTNRAEDDRSMLWGVVDVRPAAELPT